MQSKILLIKNANYKVLEDNINNNSRVLNIAFYNQQCEILYGYMNQYPYDKVLMIYTSDEFNIINIGFDIDECQRISYCMNGIKYENIIVDGLYIQDQSVYRITDKSVLVFKSSFIDYHIPILNSFHPNNIDIDFDKLTAFIRYFYRKRDDCTLCISRILTNIKTVVI